MFFWSAAFFCGTPEKTRHSGFQSCLSFLRHMTLKGLISVELQPRYLAHLTLEANQHIVKLKNEIDPNNQL